MNDMNSPLGPGREKAENYPEHTPLALIRGLLSDYRTGKPAGTGMRVTQNLYHRISRSRDRIERMFDLKLTLLFGI